jgi:hypothetical protein
VIKRQMSFNDFKKQSSLLASAGPSAIINPFNFMTVKTPLGTGGGYSETDEDPSH